MKKNKLIINSIALGIIVLLCLATVLLSQSGNKNAEVKAMAKIDDFKLIKISASDEYSLGNFKLISYEQDEQKLKPYVTDFIKFLDNYEYVPGKKDPKFYGYFTNIDYDADILDGSFDMDLFRESLRLIGRYVDTDWWVGANVVTDNIKEIKVLSKQTNANVMLLPKPVTLYKVGAILEVTRGSLFDEKVKPFKDLRMLEFTIVEDESGYKIHDLDSLTDIKQIQGFIAKFGTEDKEITLDGLIKDLTENKDNSKKIIKYVPKQGDGPKQKLNYDTVKRLDDSLIQKIVDEVDDETVVITNCDENGKVKSIGSGFFIRPGIIATNCHVIAGAKKLDIFTRDGKQHQLDGVIVADGVVDLAILKLTEEVGPSVKLGDPNLLKKENPVIAIGHPLGVTYSVAVGAFTAVVKNDEITFLQSSLPLAPGNSGGPLINTNGEVVGINTAIRQFGDVAYSLPVSYLKKFKAKTDAYKFSDIKVVKLN